MVFRIKKWKHWPVFWCWLKSQDIWTKKKAIGKVITFDYSCKYELPGTEDDEDVNKLFGIGYFWNHHKDSARFGWYCKDGEIVIAAYLYINAKREFHNLCTIKLGFHYKFYIIINPGYYTFKVQNISDGLILAEANYFFEHDKVWSYALGPYFGGNNPAPHDMEITMKNI